MAKSGSHTPAEYAKLKKQEKEIEKYLEERKQHQSFGFQFVSLKGSGQIIVVESFEEVKRVAHGGNIQDAKHEFVISIGTATLTALTTTGIAEVFWSANRQPRTEIAPMITFGRSVVGLASSPLPPTTQTRPSPTIYLDDIFMENKKHLKTKIQHHRYKK